MIKKIHYPKKNNINFRERLPQKTVILTNNKGKYAIKDEFVGYYVKSSDILDFINGTSIYEFISKIISKLR